MAKIKYQCPNCDVLHNDYEDALYCCEPEIERKYFCWVCDKEHSLEDWADQCCDLYTQVYDELDEDDDPVEGSSSKWRCNICEQLHESEAQVNSCIDLHIEEHENG